MTDANEPKLYPLTDAHCDQLRRLNLSFNDMVRAIYYDGYMLGNPELADSVLVKRDLLELAADALGRHPMFAVTYEELIYQLRNAAQGSQI